MAVVGEAEVQGDAVEVTSGILRDPLGGVEQPQALLVLVDGQAGFGFEHPAQVVRGAVQLGRDAV